MIIKQFKSQFEYIKSKIIAHETHVCVRLVYLFSRTVVHVRLNLSTHCAKPFAHTHGK